jgi:hypothetical protein
VALVIAVGIAVAAALQSEPDVANIPAPPFDTPQQAAEAYLAVLVSGDYDVYQALLAPNAWDRLLGNLTVVSAETVAARFQWWSAYTVSFDDLQCEPESATVATCTYAVEDLGLAAYAPDGMVALTRTFTIDDQGLLLAISREEIEFTDEQIAAIAPFNEWYKDQFPDLHVEINAGIHGEQDLTRSVEEIIADNNAAIEQYVGTLGS